jgi:PLP dependent protein
MTAVPDLSAADAGAVGERLAGVRSAIAEATRESGRQPEDITTIVVTKFHPASLVRDLADLGVRDFGESRHQEARAKVAEVALPDLTWHFVGQVQSKKARQIAEYARVIHSIDRVSLLDALSSQDRTTEVFLQVNLTDDSSRGGVQPDALLSLAEHAMETSGVRLLGVMAVAPLDEDPRLAFSRVRDASMLLRSVAPEASAISAGMSGDFREALLEGATHLRIGTAITGNRPTSG